MDMNHIPHSNDPETIDCRATYVYGIGNGMIC